jgi:hypothetical protein
MKLRQERGIPTFVLMRRGSGANGHTPLAARDEIECPSLASLQMLIRHRVTAPLEVLSRLPPVSSSLLASVVDSYGFFCTFNHAPKIECVYTNAKHICGDKAVLRRVQSDQTDHETVEGRNNKPGPHLSSEQDRRDDGEKTR